jgi:diadenosine tetraphosphate (Ap4A) HIT family hydrolase
MENLEKNENSNCPFCNVSADREIIIENPDVFCMFDLLPVTKGHSLIIPTRHCADYFDLTEEEQSLCWKMVNELKIILSEKYHPDGFNVGININEAAGQTVFHVHIHLIPRYKGDFINPYGGVRGFIPIMRDHSNKNKGNANQI